MATGSLTNCPWLFQKIIRPLGLQALQALDHLPWPATSEADSWKATQPQQPPPQDNHGVTDSRKPAVKDADFPEAGPEERRLQEAGQDRNHQSYTT